MAPCGKDIHWRNFEGCIPRDAIAAGHGLYVGQSVHENALIPGGVYQSGLFVFEHNGKVEKTGNVKILCAQSTSRFNWEPIEDISITNRDILERAVEAGYEGNTRLYVGRVLHQGEWKVSKVDVSLAKKMYVWNSDGTTHLQNKFELLTYS